MEGKIGIEAIPTNQEGIAMLLSKGFKYENNGQHFGLKVYFFQTENVDDAKTLISEISQKVKYNIYGQRVGTPGWVEAHKLKGEEEYEKIVYSLGKEAYFANKKISM